MKKSIINIRNLFLIIVLCSGTIISNSQDSKLNKPSREKVKKTQKIASYNAYGKLLASNRFVFEADRGRIHYGGFAQLNPALNYIMVDSLSGEMQFESQFRDIEIRKAKCTLLKNDKDHKYELLMVLDTENGTYRGVMFINADGSAEIRLDRNIIVNIGGQSESINYFYGDVTPLKYLIVKELK